LREGIGLRGYAQHDPLVVYKEEAYNLFQRLIKAIEGKVVDVLMRVEIQGMPKSNQTQSSEYNSPKVQYQGADENMTGGAIANTNLAPTMDANSGVSVRVRQPGERKTETMTRAYPKVGRNDPCPCGATKSDGKPVKYKNCHGK
jgi:preprotein translocase subunit SecA